MISVDQLENRPRTVTLTWNRHRTCEVDKARKMFDEYTRKGWIAFSVTPENEKIQIFAFNQKIEKIVLAVIVEGG